MIIPELNERELDEIASTAEKRLYKLIRNSLPNDYLVIFQASWILADKRDTAGDGEIDFLVCHPQKGFITMEVKGGGVAFDAVKNTWTSTDFRGAVHSIKDPFSQALNAKYAISKKLKEQQKDKPNYFARATKGHCVFFPDIQFSPMLSRADTPKQIIGTSVDLNDIRNWIDSVFQFWSSDKNEAPGSNGLAQIRNTFAKSFKFTPLTSSFIAENEEQLLRLTADQIKLLQFISHHRRVTIRGGAGTGKTVLAVEKAKQLAEQGFYTLLTCYNRPLADYLASNLSDIDNLTVLSVHQLASKYINAVKTATNRDLEREMKFRYPGQNSWNVHIPLALWEATELVQTRFDAIVCDEAQDIPNDFWLPLQNLLADFDEGPIYLFRDDNQDIYDRENREIFTNAPFQLTQNCRNSSEIHDVAYAFYTGPEVTATSDSNIPVTHLLAKTLEDQRDLILAKLRALLNDPGIEANQIVVLVSSKYRTTEMKQSLSNLSISKSSRWSANHVRADDEILIETVKRFKGLESPIVLLWIDDEVPTDVISEEIYVGASRARSQLIMITKFLTKHETYQSKPR